MIRWPHDPTWNLIPRNGQPVPWTCTWHGTVRTVLCAECRREFDQYRATGTWDDLRPQAPVPVSEVLDAIRERRLG